MVIQDGAIVPDQHVRVPDISDACVRALVEAHRYEHAGLTRRVGHHVEFRARHPNRVRGQRAKEVVVMNRRLQGAPEGKRGDIRLWEYDELCAVSGCLADDGAGLIS